MMVTKHEAKKTKTGPGAREFALRRVGWMAGSALLVLAIARCSPITPSVLKQAYQDQKTVGEISTNVDEIRSAETDVVGGEGPAEITFELAAAPRQTRRSIRIAPHEKSTVRSVSIGFDAVEYFRNRDEVELTGAAYSESKERIAEVIFFVDMNSREEVINHNLMDIPLSLQVIRGRGYRLKMDDRSQSYAAQILRNTLIDIVFVFEERSQESLASREERLQSHSSARSDIQRIASQH